MNDYGEHGAKPWMASPAPSWLDAWRELTWRVGHEPAVVLFWLVAFLMTACIVAAWFR